MKKYLLASAGAFLIPVMVWALPNPASVNCASLGGRLNFQAKNDSGAVCEFPNGEQCEEWALLRGDCQITQKQEKKMEVRNGRVYPDETRGVPATEVIGDSGYGGDEGMEKLRHELQDIDEKMRELRERRQEILKKLNNRIQPQPDPRPLPPQPEPVTGCTQGPTACVTLRYCAEDEDCAVIQKTVKHRCETNGMEGLVSVRPGACEKTQVPPAGPTCDTVPGRDFCTVGEPEKVGTDDRGCAQFACRADESHPIEDRIMPMEKQIVPAVERERTMPTMERNARDRTTLRAVPTSEWDKPAVRRVLNVKKSSATEADETVELPWWKKLRWQH